MDGHCVHAQSGMKSLHLSSLVIILPLSIHVCTDARTRCIPFPWRYRFFNTHVDAHVPRFLSLSCVWKLSSCRCPDRLEWAVLDDADGGAWAYARGVVPGMVFGSVCCTRRQSASLTPEEDALKSRNFMEISYSTP